MSWLAGRSAWRVAALSAAWVLGVPAAAALAVLVHVWPERGHLMRVHLTPAAGDAWRAAALLAGPPAALLVAVWVLARRRTSP
jgi:predicted outer membrane lipoprotein